MSRTLTVTAKGEVLLDKEIVEKLGAFPGQEIAVDVLPGKGLRFRVERPTGRIEDLFGILTRPGQPTLTIEEMNEAIADGWAGKR